MQNEEIDMFEILQTINETVTIIQQDTADLKKDLTNFKIETRERLNRIESNMVNKDSFNNLVKVLENKKVIFPSETAYLLIPANDYLK